ncbi:amino acid carrier protein [Oleidesulfovibrio alaskensis G20]|uniref:Amino acid carrier protein n=1 Tax=Oleidesulfovibrio alaskensis (strain ATCC BAA-1058 / DSM 17464 / G20) TaxID=207559 RepID=Q310K3_OLEA2|nr:sodium:alanine symporter family protein [Oleidesulfovibrio alaskensis]ABB38643.1 amino acid carrier protein [Oleidesulfovibrio alaskensis G20]MBG0773875.1 sodium:alanine symporter family protein [Oleidesulfovibrio alaskensis]MBL3581655.1 sodium:alanine symporter family protein [Oleidesulfovibrio alaskensis]MBL3588134.1 sodium:alanine symporter family protein [bacterium]
MQDFLNLLSGYVWGWPLMLLLVGTGVWLTILLKGVQFSKLAYALHLAFIKRKEHGAEGDISHFQALMTALSATVGTGNIAGVATAIFIGGPGALFWMWMTGLVGMATKYGEAVLAVKYRIQDEDGTMSGGPMYYISNGLGWKWLGSLFAFFAAVAAFGIGSMVQSNSVADAINHSFNIAPEITGITLMVFTAFVIIGGIKSIGRVTSILVPFMIVLYMAGSLVILVIHADKIPGALSLVFEYAFSPVAASGGFAGAAVMLAIRMGVARGLFSNESGLGSAPIAAAAAQTNSPVMQALVSMTQTFIDTIIVCSMTGLVILVTGAWTSGENGASLTSYAYSLGLPGSMGGLIVTVGIILFAYSTILGWSYYGEKSIGYLLGTWAVKPYRWLFVASVGLGAVLKLDVVWTVSDIFNGLMAFPNLIGLIMLSPVIASETKKFFNGGKPR